MAVRGERERVRPSDIASGQGFQGFLGARGLISSVFFLLVFEKHMNTVPVEWRRRPLMMKDLDIHAELQSEYLWEQREEELFHWNIMCAIHHNDEFPNNDIWGMRYGIH